MNKETITDYPAFFFHGFCSINDLFLRVIRHGKRYVFLCVEKNPETMSITNWMPSIADAVSEKFIQTLETSMEQKEFIKKASWIAAYPPRINSHHEWIYALVQFDSPIDLLWHYLPKESIAEKIRIDVNVLMVNIKP